MTWIINALLLASLLVAMLLKSSYSESRAFAAGGGLETNGTMIGTTESDQDRLVLVDTTNKNIMVYKTTGVGQFRLTGARSYKYDVEINGKDTSKVDEIETHKGITFMRAYELYEEAHKISQTQHP